MPIDRARTGSRCWQSRGSDEDVALPTGQARTRLRARKSQPRYPDGETKGHDPVNREGLSLQAIGRTRFDFD